MTRTESIGRRFGGSFIVVVVFAIACAFAIIAISLDYVDRTTRAMSAIASNDANRKAHERTAANIAKKGVMPHAAERQHSVATVHKGNLTAPVTNNSAKIGNVTGAISTIESAAAKPVTQNRGAATTNSLERHRNNTTRGGSESTRANDAVISATRLSGAASQRIVAAENSEADKPIARPAVNPSPAETPRTGHIPLRPIQEDAWGSAPSATGRSIGPTLFSSAIVTTSAGTDAPVPRHRPVEHPSNATPRDLSGLPMYRLIPDGASWYRMVPDGAAEAEDIITTVTFRRNDPTNKVDLTHPISVCVEYPDAADHARSCGSANWMAPESDSLTIDVVMPRRNTSGEPYARFGRNITCNVTYYDETNGTHTVVRMDQWSGGDCGAMTMIVVGGQP